MSAEDRKTVLVIDDSPVDVAVISEILKEDYRVIGTTGSQQALEILGAHRLPDLIILDVMMPGTDGLEFCRLVKEGGSTAGIPIIFVTAKDAVEDEAAGFAAGAVDYVAKPVNPHLVRARVRTHLELKQIRESLEKQNETLKENARLREEMEQIYRHDLKNPLMVVLGMSDVLSRQPNITGQQKQWVGMVEEAARRMLEMINRSIDLCKMENRAYQLQAAPVDALQIARQVAAMHTAAVAQKGLSFRFLIRGQPAGSEDCFLVVGEELLLFSMFSNLLRNAVEAAHPGTAVTIDLGAEGAGRIAIHNEGAIPEEIRGRFFEKFATAGKPGGTGLGAYSAKLMATTMGGTIGFESSEAAGTTIIVALPLGRSA